MEYSGQATKYKINRPLTEEEYKDQLRQKTRNEVEPHYSLAVININSTFLECTDKYYGFKGFMFFVNCMFLTIVLCFLIAIILSPTEAPAWAWFGILTPAISVILLLLWLASYESFTYTHYPIRLNRKTRMVHVFRRDGTVLSKPWRELFFTFGRGSAQGLQNWDIRGHVLAADRKTVLETFAFAKVDHSRALLLEHWEFIRRYMEEGPETINIDHIELCLPIAKQKETFMFGITRMCSNLAGIPILFWLLFPLFSIFGIFRYLAMQTCKIPQWPDEVEKTCAIEPNDPYRRDSGWEAPRA